MNADLEKRARELLAEIRFRCVDSDRDWHNMEAKDDVRLHNDLEALAAALSAGQADARRLDWLDRNGFTAYRAIDAIDGLSDHCVVVHETQKPQRGNVADTMREAIDAAIAASGERGEVSDG